MDRLEQIAATAQVCALILGNVETGDFALLPLTGASLTRPYLERVFWSPRRLRICGVTGLVNGCPRTALSEPLEDEDIRGLAQLFTEYCAQVFAERPELSRAAIERVEAAVTAVDGTLTAVLATPVDESVAWCERLYWLPDTRD